MKKMMMIALCILALAGLVMAQTYTGGATGGFTGIDKLGAHQNGGRGCVGCHAPHSGAWGNGGNAIGGTVTMSDTGNVALWGQDIGPLYTLASINTGGGDFDVNISATASEAVYSGVILCLSCHDGNVARGGMMQNASYEQTLAGFPAGYGPGVIPTLLGNDKSGTAGNYLNDHPIGEKANIGALGLGSRVILSTCTSHGVSSPCVAIDPANTQYTNFVTNYGAFQVPKMVLRDVTDKNSAYMTCSTCHTPHTMHIFRGTAGGVANQVLPSFFFIRAPYNPGADISAGKASSATQFCRQCHFSGAGGANESYGINTVTTAF